VGLSVPRVRPPEFLELYRLLEQAVKENLLASCRTLTRGGAEVDLSAITPEAPAHAALYSESPGRFLVSVAPEHRERLEALFRNQPLQLLGEVRPDRTLVIRRQGRTLMKAALEDRFQFSERRGRPCPFASFQVYLISNMQF